MRKLVILLTYLAIAAILAGVVYYGYLFFFSREGITLSASDICAENGTSNALIFLAAADHGAEFVEFVEPGSTVCAPSPISGDTGKVAASDSEDFATNCTIATTAGQRQVLTVFDADNGCVWRAD